MNGVERKLQAVIDKIDISNRRLPRRPSVSGDQLRAEIKRIDTKLTTTSMKLVEEKSLLRKKDVLKARLKELVGFETPMQEIHALKEQRRALIAEKRNMGAQVAEMQRGLRRLGLAGRLGVAARDLAHETIEVPHEAIGRVIGKRRAALTQLEEDCRLSITEEIVRFEPVAPSRQHGANNTGSNTIGTSGGGGGGVGAGGGGDGGGGETMILNLCGTRDGVAEARRRLDLTIRTTESIINTSPPLAAALRSSKRALLIRLEEELRVKIIIGSPIVLVRSGAGGGGGGGGDGGDGTGTDDASLGQGIEAGGSGGGDRGQGARRAGGDGASGTTVSAVEVILRGVPEAIQAARINLAGLERDCVEVVVPVERRSINAIFGAVEQMQADYSVFIDVESARSEVVVKGVRADVEMAAGKIREISHEFRTTEERFLLQPYQVKFLRHNRHAEVNAISRRFSIGVSIVSTPVSTSTDSDKGGNDKPKPPAAVDTAGAAAASSSASATNSADVVTDTLAEQGWGGRSGATDGPGPDDSSRRATTQAPGVAAGGQGAEAGLASYVVLRGTAPMVTRARPMLLDRLKAAERLTAKLPISGEAVATFVGHGGSAIRKLRRLCVGCSVDLSPVGAEGFAEVSLMAEDEAKLGVAKGLVEKWISQQQLRVVTVGSEMAGMLRTFRAAGVREKIIGGTRQQEGGGGGAGGEDELFCGVHLVCVVEEGVVRLRGREEELDRAERLIREFQKENWTTEVPVALDDEDVLVRRGLLREAQAKQPDVHFQYLRDRRVVLVRGRREVVERAAKLLQATVHGGGLDGHGAAVLRMSLVPLAPSGVRLLTARGRFHLKRLSKDTGADLDVVPSTSVVRVRARRPDTAAAVVADAKRALLRLVGSQLSEVLIDLAAVGSSSSWPPSPAPLSSIGGGGFGGGGGQSGVKWRTGPRGTMQAVMGSDESDDEGGNGTGDVAGGGSGGGGGGGAAIARKVVGVPNRSVSNESVRRTARLHGCEVEFVAAPPSFSGKGVGVGVGGGGGAVGSGANANRNSGAASSRAGSDNQQRQALNHNNNPPRQDSGRGGGTEAVAVAAAAAPTAGVQPATAGGAVTAPRNTQPRPVSVRGPPGLVEKARDALVALVLGREESEISLGAWAAAALGPGSWREIQESSNNVSITLDSSRCSLKVSGPPAAVEECRKGLYAMLGDVFRGRFHVVPIPREALHEVATPLILADAAAAAAAAAVSPDCGDRKPAAVAAVAEVLGPVGAAAAAAGWVGELNVQLLADWPCSCVRVRGDATAVRVAVEAIRAALSEWSALEVTAAVEDWMLSSLLGKQRKAIKKLSKSLGGVVLRVSDGVCRGRATSAEAARKATRKLEERVSEIRAERAVVLVPSDMVGKLKGQGGSSFEKRTRTTIEIEIKEGGEGGNSVAEVCIKGDPNAVAAAKREVEALNRGLTKTEPASKAESLLPTTTGSAGPSPSPRGRPNTAPLHHPQQHASSGSTTAHATDGAAWETACKATTKTDKAAGATIAANAKAGGGRGSAEDGQRAVAQGPQPAQSAAPAATGDGRKVRQRAGTTVVPSRPEHLSPFDASDMTGTTTTTTTEVEPICFGSFETKSDDRTGSGDPTSRTGSNVSKFGTPQNNSSAAATKRSPMSRRAGGGGERNKRVSAATESEAERLLASLLLVDNAAAGGAGPAAGFPRSSPRQLEAFPVAMMTNAWGGTGQRNATRDGDSSHGRQHQQHQQHHRRNSSHSPRQPAIPTGPSLSLSSCGAFNRNNAGSCAAGFASPCNAGTVSPPRVEAAPAAGGAEYFASSSGVRVRL
eukprot:g6862.t1